MSLNKQKPGTSSQIDYISPISENTKRVTPGRSGIVETPFATGKRPAPDKPDKNKGQTPEVRPRISKSTGGATLYKPYRYDVISLLNASSTYSCDRTENLKKGAAPVNKDDIIDMIQTNMFAEIGCGPLCRVNPLTDRGKRFQLFKILCLTVIPILGVWGFTMYSLSDSVENKSDIETAKGSMSIVVVLGRLIHRLQMERDMSVLYLSDLGPGTKTFLLAEYMATDDALEQLTIWPGALQSNPKEQYRSKVNLMSYIAQHRTSLNPKKVDLFEEINFYSDITSAFLEWLVENIKGSGFGSTWKTLVAYQKITRCKEDIGVERAYGAMFYTNGHFPKWVDFEFYNYQVHDFKYNYKTAVFYSDIVVPLLREEVKELKSTGVNITVTINAYRYEIQYHDLNTSYKSEEKTKWFFDNMTEYLDSLLDIQEEVAGKITEEVEAVLSQIVTKVVIYASMVVVVIAMCPVIMFSSEALASDIQRYTQTLVEKTKELNLEKHKTDTLLYQMVPTSIAERLKSSTAVESEFFRSVTIFFSGIFGFSRVCIECSPMDLVKILNSLYTSMDEQIGLYDVYKVETINDCYMVASGLPNRNDERHVTEIANLALDVLHMSRNKKFPGSENTPIQLQIGINTGSVSAGIVGTVMLRYCLFGDTVNIASRMKTYGLPNRIHISENTYTCLKKAGKFKMKFRGNLDIKGKGPMDTYWLLDKAYGSSIANDEMADSMIPGQMSSHQDTCSPHGTPTMSSKVSPTGKRLMTKRKEEVSHQISKGMYISSPTDNDNDGGETMK